MYGRAWTLKTGIAGVGSSGNPGKPGSLVGESGILSYQEVRNTTKYRGLWYNAYIV